MTQTELANRAAHYVGMADQPRTSIAVRPGEAVLTIWDSGYVLLYSEVNGHRHGEWFKLTANRHEKILEALDRVDV